MADVNKFGSTGVIKVCIDSLATARFSGAS